MTKKYNSPMLNVISINNHIIATSGPAVEYTTTNSNESLVGAPDRFRDYYEGY
jgi:hypothetical protein